MEVGEQGMKGKEFTHHHFLAACLAIIESFLLQLK